MKRKMNVFSIVLNLFFVLLSLLFVLPLILVISASFSSETGLMRDGFSLIPSEFSTEAYRMVFQRPQQMIQSYIVTICQAALGTVTSSLVAALAAYPLSRSNFRFKKVITVFIMFTMFFNAGMIPNYIVIAKYYKISNSFWVYILPGIAGGAWNTMVFRTFFKGLPESLFESARLDGAKELTIFFRIVLPLSTPVFASLGFLALVTRWNNYTTSMIYIRDESLYTLQYLLQRIMNEATYLKNLMNSGMNIAVDAVQLPSETLKYAMCIIAAGPMLVIFPFFQKYFSKGLTVGSVKE